METIVNKFCAAVIAAVKSQLAERRAKDENETMAFVKFNVVEVLKELGASFVTARVEVGEKGYAMLRIEAADQGFYYPIDFFQRRQGTAADLEALKDARVDEAICIAGIREDEEGTHFSMKWDALIDGGELITLSGPVRKFGDGVMAE